MEPFFPVKPEPHYSQPRRILINDYNRNLLLYNDELKSFEAARRALVQREADLESLRNAIEMVEE